MPRGKVRLAHLLPKITREAFRDRGFYQASILTNWADIVGKEMASRSCPEKISKAGVLTVRVEGSFALEFQHIEPQLLERIATHFGHKAVGRISLRQGPIPRDKT
ncbi:MAG: hypothetical protein CMM32_05870 [Rhodospirillaceae bacterium]|nr:hypothetical protein [Rhodospirillaceae bacterium]